jgi:hypothetical protein
MRPLFTAVCERQHALARVYVRSDGLWLFAKGAETLIDAGDMTRHNRVSGIPTRLRLGDLDGPIDVACPHRFATLDPHWVRAQIAARKRRAVVPGSQARR